MGIFMVEVFRSSRTGSWGPAQTLTHVSWSHHQHHNKSFLQHTHFSFPVTLPKTLIFYERAQWCLWWMHTCSPDHSSNRILYQTEPCDGPKMPDQQGSTTPTDGCKCSCRSAVSSKCSSGPGLFLTGRKVLYLIFAQGSCPNKYWTPDASAQASRLCSLQFDAQFSLCSQLIEGLSHGKHQILNEFYRQPVRLLQERLGLIQLG